MFLTMPRTRERRNKAFLAFKFGAVPVCLGILVTLVVCLALWASIKIRWKREEEWDHLKMFLKNYDLNTYESELKEAGIVSRDQLGRLTKIEQTSLKDLPEDTQKRLEKAAQAYREEVDLLNWLQYNQLEKLFPDLRGASVIELVRLSKLSHSEWTKACSREMMSDVNFKKAVEYLRLHEARLTTEKPWNIGLIVVTLFAGMVVAIMNIPSYCANQSKHSLLEFVTGKYLAVQLCKVIWDWEEPQCVGKTMTFRLQFYQRNGRPYPISDQDKLLIEIIQGSCRIPPTVQHGGTEASDINTARVSFTVHRAGQYHVSVMIGAKHIRESPFVKTFLPGPIDPSKSGFASQASIVVSTKGQQYPLDQHGLSYPLYLEPRDVYGNACIVLPGDTHTERFTLTLKESGACRQWSPKHEVKYDSFTKKLSLRFLVEFEGCFQATTTYKGVKLKNGEFSLIVLNDCAARTVSKSVTKKSHNLYYKAKLLSYSEDKHKPKKVYCYISPKQFTIKEFYLKFIPRRLFTFRVCPSTKFQFSGTDNQTGEPLFTIDDGCQAPVELSAKDRNIIAATFSCFLRKNIGGSETFKDKQDYFYHEVRQLHSDRLHDRLCLKISRDNLFESCIKATKHFSTSDWCKNFEIVFVGEEGLDWGGLRREWFHLLCAELFDPAGSGLFTRFKDDTQALVHPNPRRPVGIKLKLYEFAGRIVGKCLYESSLGGGYRQLVKARFTRSFLAQLIGLRVHHKYFEQDDPDLYVSKIKYIEDNDVDDMELTFTEDEYKDGKLEKVVELIPGGSKISVTNGNKLKYLDALAQYKLANNVREEIDSFLKGVNELIPDSLLSFFDEYELELLMCGTGNYCVTDFLDHHVVCGSSPEFRKVLEWFWTIVSGFTQEEMARLLQFITGCSQLPAGGFSELNPRLQIAATPTYNTLPTAHTCFNQLCLPDYESMEQMHRLLVLAINEGNQGFGLV